MSGNLPQSLSSLKSLTQLFLQNNKFTGKINMLGKLPLEQLNLANNKFTGWITVSSLKYHLLLFHLLS
ncbi:Protein STRUBBELIG-RECEPTOR FAMILY 7 [Linum perenne]